MRQLLEFTHRELASGRGVVSAVIVSSSGSTPRSAGSRMAVAADGSARGTVGGGPAEAMAQREAQRLHQTQRSLLLKLDLTGKQAADAGMICGGKQEILLEYIPPDPENTQLFSLVLSNWDRGLVSALCTAFADRGQEADILARTLDPALLPSSLPQALRQEADQLTARTRTPAVSKEQEYCVLVEPISSPGNLCIAGAGHVGKTTAELAAYVGFATLIVDDRADFLSRERFPDARTLRQVPGFEDCFSQVDLPRESFIVIVTRGHVHDKNVLAQALTTQARYIGMIGSRKKRDAIYSALREQGVPQSELDRVHCPIGLSIGADTPEEIAVSIVGELIQERAG